MKRLAPLLAGAVLLPLLPLSVAAAEFNLVWLDKSQVTFLSKQMGVPIEGRFGKFAARIAFDPARPEAGRAQIDIDLTTLDAGSTDANDEARKPAWFDTRRFPQARFVASGVKPLGGGRFEARGQMTIKGQTREVVAPFSVQTGAAGAVISGSIPVMRLQYGIGEGMWSDTAAVADEVQVKFRFVVTAGQ